MADAIQSNDAIKAAANADSAALLAKAVKSAQLAIAEEGEPAEEPSPVPLQTTGKKPEAEKPEPADDKTVVLKRGPDGKFLKPGEKAPEPKKADEKKPEPEKAAAKPKDEADGDVPASLAKARRLFASGQLEEGAKLVGLDLEKLTGKQWESWRHENKKARADLAKNQEALETKHRELVGIAQRLQPLLGAQQALQAGDFDAFLNMASGGTIPDVSAFNKKAIAKLHGSAPLDADSQRRLAQAEQRAAQAEQAAKDLAARLEKADQEKALPAAQKEYKATTLRNEVELLDDDEFASLADDPSFIDEVFDVKNEHWNEQTRRTIATDQAAVIAHRRWLKKQTTDPGGSGSTRDRGASSTRQPAGAVTPARRPARAGTNLNSQEAAEAAPAPKLEGKALQDYWVRKAQADIARDGV